MSSRTCFTSLLLSELLRISFETVETRRPKNTRWTAINLNQCCSFLKSCNKSQETQTCNTIDVCEELGWVVKRVRKTHAHIQTVHFNPSIDFGHKYIWNVEIFKLLKLTKGKSG